LTAFGKSILTWLKCQLTFQKILVVALVYKGIGWVDQSYALAWAGKNEIASELSQRALVELLGVALLYAAKSLFENISKNNKWGWAIIRAERLANLSGSTKKIHDDRYQCFKRLPGSSKNRQLQ
jgi:hypothetical protein